MFSGLQTQWDSCIMNYGKKHDKHRDFFEFHGMQAYIFHQSLLDEMLWNITDWEIPDSVGTTTWLQLFPKYET